MSQTFDMNFTGARELDKLLDALPSQIAKRVVRGALLKSAKPILVDAKNSVPVNTGRLKKSLTAAKAKKSDERPGDAKVLIGARVGGKYKGYHFHLVEFGTKNMRARPFLFPAVVKNTGQQRKILTREIAKRTHAEALKLATKFRTLK